MTQRRAGIYNRCPGCKLNNGLCVCSTYNPFTISTNVSLIVHVRELKLTSNTAQFVEKLLPQNAKIYIRGRVHENFDAAPVLQNSGTPVFLYPHEDALEIEEFKKIYPGPYHVIIPDGNWHQARKVRKREELFKTIPAIKLSPNLKGEYVLRKAPQPEWVSTFEAVAYALGALEGEQVQERMMAFFRNWVRTAYYNRTKSYLE